MGQAEGAAHLAWGPSEQAGWHLSRGLSKRQLPVGVGGAGCQDRDVKRQVWDGRRPGWLG